MGLRFSLQNANSVGHFTDGNIFSFLRDFSLLRDQSEGSIEFLENLILNPGRDFLCGIHGSEIPFQGSQTILQTSQAVETRHPVCLLFQGKTGIGDDEKEGHKKKTENPEKIKGDNQHGRQNRLPETEKTHAD